MILYEIFTTEIYVSKTVVITPLFTFNVQPNNLITNCDYAQYR